jgi:hypothetical protein
MNSEDLFNLLQNFKKKAMILILVSKCSDLFPLVLNTNRSIEKNRKCRNVC